MRTKTLSAAALTAAALPAADEAAPQSDEASRQPAAASAGAADAEIAADPVPTKTAWLTTRWSEAFGSAGSFVDLTEAELAAVEASTDAGLLVAPTPEQLALRV